MINLRVVLCVFLCAALAVGCASAVSPTISPTGVATPPPSAVVPEMTETFISSNYGFSVRYPDSGTIEPATSLWSPVNVPWPDGAFDYTKSELSGVFRAASATAPEGFSMDDWIDAFITNTSVGTCNPPRSTLPEISIDGQSGRIRDGCPGEVEATVVVGQRAYVFTLFSDAPNARAVFDAIAATIDLRPEEALEVPSPTPS